VPLKVFTGVQAAILFSCSSSHSRRLLALDFQMQAQSAALPIASDVLSALLVCCAGREAVCELQILLDGLQRQSTSM